LGRAVGKAVTTTLVLSVTAFVTGAALFAACVGVRGGSHELVNGVIAGGSRYAVAPTLVIAAPLIVIIERSPRLVRVAAVALTLSVWVSDVRTYNLRAGDMSWERGVAIARTQCRHGIDPARLPILPLTPSDEWEMRLPCAYVEAR
jgi:hypothetical protein